MVASGEQKECSCGEPFRPEDQFCRKCGKARPTRKDEGNFQILARKAAYIATTEAFLVPFLGSWICFAITLLLFTYGYMMIPFLCWVWTIAVILWIGFALLFHCVVQPGRYTVPLSTGCFLCVVCGTFLGMYIYDSSAIFPMFYRHARMYTNVVASEPSAAVADAGKITFNEQTKVDTKKSCGYTAENGMVFCVAPVMDPSRQPRIEYWAAGIDCCTESGEFSCDAAGNPEAQGGVVIFDNNGWFAPARYPFYQKARAKAEARHMLESVGEPIFVRWVEKDNLNYLQDYYGDRALYNVIGWLAGFLILSALLSFGMWQPRSMVSA